MVACRPLEAPRVSPTVVIPPVSPTALIPARTGGTAGKPELVEAAAVALRSVSPFGAMLLRPAIRASGTTWAVRVLVS